MKRTDTEKQIDDTQSKKPLVRTAIQLKEAIEAIPQKFKPLGSIVNAVKEWKIENEIEEEEEEYDEEDEEENNQANGEENGERNGEAKKEKACADPPVSFEQWIDRMRKTRANDKKFKPFHSSYLTNEDIHEAFHTKFEINVGDFKYDGTLADFSGTDESNLGKNFIFSICV
jgi:hypothetical protein